MFFCCNKSKEDDSQDRQLPADAMDGVGSTFERRISSSSLRKVPTSPMNENEKVRGASLEASLPPAPAETMDYARARREAEERELERVRSEISGLSMVREERDSTALRLSLSGIGSDKEKGFLGLPLSPGVSSPRLSEQKETEDEDDWARVVMESVSRAGSTYDGDKSRPVTPVVRVQSPEPPVVAEKKPKVEKQQPVTAETAAPLPATEEAKEEKVEEMLVEKEMNVEEKDSDATSLYISSEAAAAFINYHNEPLPTLPVMELEREKVDAEPEVEKKQEDEVEETVKEREETVEEREETVEERAQTPVQKQEEQQQHTSLYITPDAAASFINFDASLAPPTPAASFRDDGEATPKRISAPVRCPSPAPSFAISEYEQDIRNSKRASTLSTISTIAQAAASAAIDRHTTAGKRMSNLSTYSTASFYSTRPSSPAPPTNNRLSLLRGASPTPASRPATAKSSKSNTHLSPYLAPLTTQLLPRLDKLLSTTSILSAYSRWETAMSLRREVRAFVASGVDEFLDEDGDIDNEAGLHKAVDGFLARGQRVQEAAANANDDECDPRASGKLFGDVRAFWAGDSENTNTRNSGFVAL